jgi:hypothetical protein
MLEGRLVFELAFDFLKIHLKFFLGQFKILFLLLDISLLTMDNFLKAAHRVQELRGQRHHLLAILAPEVLENLGVLRLHVWLVLKLLHQVSVLLLSIRDLTVLGD